MGSPDFPSRQQQRQLRDAAQLPDPDVRTLTAGTASVTLTLPGQSLALVETEP
jgi:hypothetical protein